MIFYFYNSRMSEIIIPGKTIYWCVVLDMLGDCCHLRCSHADSCEWCGTPCLWNSQIMREYNRIPEVHFPTAAAAFADFQTKNPMLVEGETVRPGLQQYLSGFNYRLHYFKTQNTIVLAKGSQVALLLEKRIIDKSKLPESMNTATTLSELERLRAENAALRTSVKATRPAPSFFLPPVDSLEETREVANAFAAFYGYFIVECSPYIRGASPTNATYCGFSFGNKTIKDPAGLDCSALTIGNLINKKRFAHVIANARKLGLTRKVTQKVMITDYVKCVGKALQYFVDKLLLEHVEESAEASYDSIAKARSDYGFMFHFQSNLPLLRFMNDETRGKDITEMSVPWVDRLDPEQAWHMLQGMMIGSSEKDNTIELMSPLLAACVEKLCSIAGYSCVIENIGDVLWIATLTKVAPVSDAASVVSVRDPC